MNHLKPKKRSENIWILLQIEEYETHQELWREGINNLSDQFEFLWQEIQAEERQCKGLKKEDDDDEEEELEEELLKQLVTSVSFFHCSVFLKSKGWLCLYLVSI